MKVMTDRVTTGASYGGAAVSVIAGLTLMEWGIIVGIITAVLTFGLNVWYQHRRDRRERQMHEVKLAKLGEGSQ